MHPSIPEAWLLLVCLVHLLNRATALEIIYPKIGTVYPATGSYDVQWQKTAEFEPSELAIYLVTYKGQNISDHRSCIVSATSDGSTAITLSSPPPKGDSWTWMFYDNDYYIDLGYSYIAQSVHFQIELASPTTSAASSTATNAATNTAANATTSSSVQLSPAIAAAIGVGGTVAVVIVVLLVGYFGIYRPRQLKKNHEATSVIPYTPGHRYSKQELDSKPGTSHGLSDPNSTSTLSSADMKMNSHHEMEVYPGTGTVSTSLSSPSVASAGGELSVTARHSRLTPIHAAPSAAAVKELPLSPIRYEMHNNAQRAFHHELPGDFALGNVQDKK